MGINIGQKIPVNKLVSNGELIIYAKTNTLASAKLDYCLIGVDYNNRLSDDNYFIFFNQESSREMALQKKHGEDVFGIDFKLLPANINKLVLTATASQNYYVNDVNSVSVKLYNSNNNYIDECIINGSNYNGIKTVVIAEIFRYNNEWIIDFIGANFNGGIKEIVQMFGGEVEGEQNTQTNINPNTQVNNNQNMLINNNQTMQKSNRQSTQVNNSQQSNAVTLNMNKQEKLQKLVLEKAPRLLNMTKTVALVLEKKNIPDIPARVAVVMDYSASMGGMYDNGLVQSVLDRMLPVAMQLDDNGEMEVWIFDTKFHRLNDISLENINDYVKKEEIRKKYKMGGTLYAPVIQDVISKYIKEEPSKYPALVLFITDGDNFSDDKRKTTELIKKASSMNIFWQFIGIGSGSFSYLEKLDEMQGRVIDNANFFSVNDIMNISDEELYNRLLKEFPVWLKNAKINNIIK